MNEREESEAEALKRFEHECANTKLVHDPNELLSQTQKRIRDQEANQRLNRFLEVMDKGQPGMKREAVPIAFDEEGNPAWGIIRWRKP